jgi:TolB-like protein/cytochrome c-type biogenesis protein CcmH/NrfG
MSFFEELKRRRVFRVAISYAITAWLTLQVADIATESFDAPGWVMQTLFTVLVLGFFVAIVLAWAFQMAGGQLVRDRGEASAASGAGASASDGAGQRGLVIVLALTLVLSGVLLWDRFNAGETGSAAVTIPGEASVAVLPFANMSASEENEYFSDGLTDTLLHQLAQVSALKVAARTSSFAFKNTNTDIREIADALDVDHVLEGSVQRSGDRVRITAQLIQASDGYHLWSATFDRDLDDIFAVQDEIAAQVASALTGSLLENATDAVRVDGGTDNREAYDRYLQAREAFFEGTERSLARSNRLLREAVTLDPEFAIAWAHLAESLLRHATLAGLGWADIETEMKAAADRGVELSPDNTTTLAVKGHTIYELGNTAEGRALVERALEIDPNNVWALSYLADIQFDTNEYDAAVDSASRAMALDPLDYTLKAQSTFKYLQVGRTADATALAQAVLDRAPDSFDGLSAMGNVYWRTGNYAEAYRAYFTLVENHPNTYYIYGRIAKIFEDLGDLATAERWIERSIEINETRGKISMAYFCGRDGRKECAQALFRESMLAWDPEDEEEAEWIMEATSALAVLKEDWDGLLEVSEALLSLELERGRIWSAHWTKMNMALAAGRLDREAVVMSLTKEVEAYLDESLANGGDSQYQPLFRANALALRGEADAAAEQLRIAMERGFRNRSRIQRDPKWDRVRDEPAMQTLLTDLAVSNASELERVEAVVAEIGGV